VSLFALASTLAAAGGILAASRLLAVNQQSGSGDILLLAIAGPVTPAPACSAAAATSGRLCWARS
jgi:predicted ABC-type sugar transport system permease subunit